MSATKRPSTSSLRRYLTSRPYISVADNRRPLGPEREALKLQDLWQRDEVGVELSVEVRAPVVVGIYPMRIARFVIDQASYGHANGNGQHPVTEPPPNPVEDVAEA